MAQPSLYSRDYEILRELVVAERKRRKLTQVDVARRMRRTQSYISKLESGERRLDVLDLVKLAKAIGFNADDFMSRLIRNLGRS